MSFLIKWSSEYLVQWTKIAVRQDIYHGEIIEHRGQKKDDLTNYPERKNRFHIKDQESE